MTEISFSWCANERHLRELQWEWEALRARARRTFYSQSFDYLLGAWTLIAGPRNRRLAVLTGRFHGRLVLLLPLIESGPHLHFLSSEKFEYRDVIVEDAPEADHWVRSALAAVRRRRDHACLDLQNMPMDGMLGRILREEGKAGVSMVGNTWLIPLDRYEGWEDYAATRPARLMADQRRQWRRVEKISPDFGFHPAGADDLERLVPWVFDHKLRWARDRGINTGVFATPGYQAFTREVLRRGLDSGTSVLGWLGDADRIASAGFGHIDGDRFIFYMFAYDEAYAAYSPSRLLQERLIRIAFDRGLRLFDFLPGPEVYKSVWADPVQAMMGVLQPLNAYGHLRLAWSRDLAPRVRSHPLVSRCYTALPTALRNRLRSVLAADWDRICQMRPDRKSVVPSK